MAERKKLTGLARIMAGAVAAGAMALGSMPGKAEEPSYHQTSYTDTISDFETGESLYWAAGSYLREVGNGAPGADVVLRGIHLRSLPGADVHFDEIRTIGAYPTPGGTRPNMTVVRKDDTCTAYAHLEEELAKPIEHPNGKSYTHQHFPYTMTGISNDRCMELLKTPDGNFMPLTDFYNVQVDRSLAERLDKPSLLFKMDGDRPYVNEDGMTQPGPLTRAHLYAGNAETRNLPRNPNFYTKKQLDKE